MANLIGLRGRLTGLLPELADLRPGLNRTGPGLTGLRPTTRTVVGTGVLLAVGAGALVGSGPTATALALVAVVGIAVVVAVLLSPRAAAGLLAVMVFSRASDVLIEQHGLPSTMQPLLVLVLAALAWRAWRSRSVPLGWERAAVLLALYGIVLATGLLTPLDPEHTSYLFNAFIRDCVVVLVVICLLSEDPRGLRLAVWGAVLVGLALSLAGIYQNTVGFTSTMGGFAQAPVLNIAGSDEAPRISGPISDPNHFAQSLVTMVPLAFGRTLWSRGVLLRLVAALTVVSLVWATVLTYSRGALVAIAIVAVIFLARLWIRPWMWGLVAAAGVLSFSMLPADFRSRLLQLAGLFSGQSPTEVSLAGRLSAQLAGIDMFLAHPWLGVGLGNFGYNYPAYARGHGINTVRANLPAHNLFLEVIAETGVLGALTFGAVLVACFGSVWWASQLLRTAGLLRDSRLVGDVGCALAGYLASGLFVHNAYPRVFWFVVALCLATPVVARAMTGDRTDRLRFTGTNTDAGPPTPQPATR